MTRAVLGVLLCLTALVVGVATAVLASRNRARAGDLDRRQRGCEVLLRQNSLRQANIEQDEWLLLTTRPAPPSPAVLEH